jgi:hypothetical protein
VKGYESLRGRERAVVIGLCLIVALDVIAVISSAAELSLLGRIERGDVVSDAEIDANDTRQAAIGGIWFLLLLITAVFFIRWLRAAFRNTDVLAPGLRRHGHGWAIGGWFVPFLNLVRPKQIVDDTWRADRSRVSPLLHVWWALWIVSNVAGQIAARRSFAAEEMDELKQTSVLYMIADATDGIAALLAILVVRRITRLQEERAAAIAGAPPPEIPGDGEPPAAWNPPEPRGSVAPPGWAGAPERPASPG